MVLVFTGVVSFAILAVGISIAVVEIVNPDADTSGAATALFNLITGMMGALLGLLAGKSEGASTLDRHMSEYHPPAPPPERKPVV